MEQPNENQPSNNSKSIAESALTAASSTAKESTASSTASSPFGAAIDTVEAFLRLNKQSSPGGAGRLGGSVDQLVALSLLIPRLSPLQLTYVVRLATRQFDSGPYTHGKKCEELSRRAKDLEYLNELYTRAFEADKVSEVLMELAQLLPVVQLSGDEHDSEFAKLVHVYANMLVHCYNRARPDAAESRRFIQALAIVQPDVKERLAELVGGSNGIIPSIILESSAENGSQKGLAVEFPLPPLAVSSPPPRQQLGAFLSLPHRTSNSTLPNSSDASGNSNNNSPGAGTTPATATSIGSTVPAAGSGTLLSVVDSGIAPSLPNPTVASSATTSPQNTAGILPVSGPASLTSQHRQLSRVQTLPASTGSPAGGQSRCIFTEEGSGMRDVPMWLKGLRLHKYTHLFERITYEQMINLTDEWLEQQGVTKGATNKIMQNIVKLRERQLTLRNFERELVSNPAVDVRSIIDGLHQVINSPLKKVASSEVKAKTSDVDQQPQKQIGGGNSWDMNRVFGDDASIADGDLPGQVTRLIGRLNVYFFMSAPPIDPALISPFVKLIDRCIQHEAFTDKHRIFLHSMKQRSAQLLHQLPPRMTAAASAAALNATGSAIVMGNYQRNKPRQNFVGHSAMGAPLVSANFVGGPGMTAALTAEVVQAANAMLQQQQQRSQQQAASNSGNNGSNSNNVSPPFNPWSDAPGRLSPWAAGPPVVQQATPRGGSSAAFGLPPKQPNPSLFSNSATANYHLTVGSSRSGLIPGVMLTSPGVSSDSGDSGTGPIDNASSSSNVMRLSLGRTQSCPQTQQQQQLTSSFQTAFQQQQLMATSTPPNNFLAPGSRWSLGPGGNGDVVASSAAQSSTAALMSSHLSNLCLEMTEQCLSTPDLLEIASSAAMTSTSVAPPTTIEESPAAVTGTVSPPS